MKIVLTMIALALMAETPVRGEGLDSLAIHLQAGDSCMQQYNTFEALKHYQKAYDLAKKRSQEKAVEHLDLPLKHLEKLPQERQNEIIERLKRSAEQSAIVDCAVQMKLADCYYKRANYRQAAELLKIIPEDSLSHDAFRQLAFSYQKQGDNDSFVYWAQQLVARFPMDGEVVAGLTNGYTKANQPDKAVICGLKYSLKDSTNVLVNRALADAWFVNRSFTAAAMMYERLLEQGDSTFNTLYSAGMSYSQLDDLERAYKYLQLAFLVSGMQHAGCAYRLGVVCVDTQRYPEGLNYLSLAKELMLPDTTIMKAITLSEGEGYYLTHKYPEAIAAWKEHLLYNPSSVATYYNIANAYAYLLKDEEQGRAYYQQFVEKAAEVDKPTEKLTEMIEKAKEMLRVYELREKFKARKK